MFEISDPRALRILNHEASASDSYWARGTRLTPFNDMDYTLSKRTREMAKKKKGGGGKKC